MKKGYETSTSYAYNCLKKNAKNSRRYATQAESILWEHLRRKQLGVRFRRQHIIGEFISDFVCLSLQLIIEVEGKYHYSGNQPDNDEKRTLYLKEKGFHVIRFTNDEIIGDTKHVIDTIKQNLIERTKYMNKEYKNNTKTTSAIIPTTITQDDEATKLKPAGTPLLGRGGGGLLIFSAPSGSGKSTIVQWLIANHPEFNLAFSVSCTSRAPRGTERDGVEYFFLTPEAFKEKIQNDEFLEYEEVYEDRFYGTLKSQVDSQTAKGENVIFDVDVKGGVNIKKFYGERALSFFIQPPSVEELRRRLVGRATDAPEVIEQRLAKANYELTFANQFDYVVINDDLAKAEQETYEIIARFLGR